MFVAANDDFETTQLLLEAHQHDVDVVAISESPFGHTTTITCNIPKDQYDWLVTEIGDSPAMDHGQNYISSDFSLLLAPEDKRIQKHWTLLGLWREI